MTTRIDLAARTWWDAQVATLGVPVVLADGTETTGLLSREVLDTVEDPGLQRAAPRDRLRLWGAETIAVNDQITVNGVTYLVNQVNPVTSQYRIDAFLQRRA